MDTRKRGIDIVDDEASRESLPASDSPMWSISGAIPAQDGYGGTGHRGVLVKGVVAGLIGYATIALFFAIASVLAGRSPLHIAALLGAALLGSPADGSAIDAGAALVYNGVHLLVLLLAGLVFAWLTMVVGRVIQGWYLALTAVVFVFGHIIALPIWFDARVREDLSLWLITAGTAVATVLMAAYLWRAYPDIRRKMHEPNEAAVGLDGLNG